MATKSPKKKVLVVKKTSKKVAKKNKIKSITVKSKNHQKKATHRNLKEKKTSKVVSKDITLNSLIELIRKTSVEIPNDVQKVILEALEREEKNTSAEYAMKIIKANIELAKKKSQPLCQDTGTVLFFVSHPKNFDQDAFTKKIHEAVIQSTKLGYLRQNSVDSLTGENAGLNIGPGHPSIHFHQHSSKEVEIKLMLKGGGCENVGAQYSLPYSPLNAGRDLNGVRKVILDAILKAQGKGCGPGVLGVCIGGDRGQGYIESKEQLLRKLNDTNKVKSLKDLELEIVETANKLKIGPMGFGGNTTLLGCKIGVLNRLPASFFVSISYMCWAYRRQGVILGTKNEIRKWLY
jgi:fumarate hydratase class I